MTYPAHIILDFANCPNILYSKRKSHVTHYIYSPCFFSLLNVSRTVPQTFKCVSRYGPVIL